MGSLDSVGLTVHPALPLALYSDPVRALLFLQKRQERFVTFTFHSFDWNKMEGGRVNGVNLSGGRFRVGKEMAKVGIASFGAHLGALHIVRSVQVLDEEIFRDRFAKRGHAEAAIEFVERSEEWFACHLAARRNIPRPLIGVSRRRRSGRAGSDRNLWSPFSLSARERRS